ncbi:hypothetical protein K2X05_13915 [bacterium]|nr:hypothetical protein [bacterium]
MKIVSAVFLFLVASSTALATQWTCQAYCVVDNGSQDSILLVGHGNYPQQAFDRVALECGQINYPYLQDFVGESFLYSTSGQHHEEANVVNSCRMVDFAI